MRLDLGLECGRDACRGVYVCMIVRVVKSDELGEYVNNNKKKKAHAFIKGFVKAINKIQ